MLKKGSILILVLLLSAVAVLIWTMQKKSSKITADPYLHIPDNAYFFFESNDLPGLLNSFTRDNGLFSELARIKELEKTGKEIVYFRDLLNRNEISSYFENNRAVISFHPSGKGKAVPLMLMGIPATSGAGNIIRNISSATGQKAMEIKKGRTKFYGLTRAAGSSKDTVFITSGSGLVIASSSLSLVIEALSAGAAEESIMKLPGVSRIIGTAGKKEDKLFILFRNFSEIIKSISDKKRPDLTETFARLAGSAEGDIFISEHGIILNGYTESADTTDILYKYKTRSAGVLGIADVVPSDAVLFETVMISTQDTGIPGIKGTGDSAAAFTARLLPAIEDEIAIMLIESDEKAGEPEQMIIIELKNKELAEQILREAIINRAKTEGLKEEDYVTFFQPDDQTKIPVYRAPYRNFASCLNPGFTGKAEDSLVTFIDRFMITGGSYAAISKVLYDNILNKSLTNDVTYRDFEGTMPERAAYYFYCVPAGILSCLSQWLNDDILNILISNREILQRIPSVGYRFSASNNMIYNSLSVRFGEEIIEESGAEWETLLESEASIKPFFFSNHITGAKEIFIQDDANDAYLINSAGRVLWKVTLNEKILGQVSMIDFYRNGKYQLLFASRNWLHLIDRNGNYVERFPVRLRAPASGPPALFDYDGNKEYRILIPGEDRLIYAYDKSGNVVKGWKPFKTNGLVKSEVKFFRISGKDYLIATDNTGIYILDRTGNIRVRLKKTVTRASGSELRLTSGRNPSVIFSSPDGTVTTVSFDGNSGNFDLGRFTVDHSFDFFDVDGDGYGEYIFIDRGKLYLYDNDRSLVFEKDFGSEALEGPISFTFSPSDRKIGVFDNNKKLIYLVDRRGNIMDGFPLKGTSLFSIGKLSERGGFNLIVGGNNNFLYNYKLNID